ncbi:MAG: SDR family oxidoreductase, partial [Acidimicrobiia bacterium]
LKRIVYLGGLGSGSAMSKHLSSRQEVGSILAGGNTPVTELRAAVIIGSGSVSFEMLRYLTEVLPAMITPSWVRTRCQPIAVADILSVLVAAISEPGSASHIKEIGGPDQLTYEEMMHIYADVAGLPRRLILPVPFLSPKLSSHWVGLVTPLPSSVAKPLVESLRVEVTVSDNGFAESTVERLIGYREAVERALRRSTEHMVETRWSDTSPRPPQLLPGDPVWAGGTVQTDEKLIETSASTEDVFWAFARLGGTTGYYTMNWAWSVRGWIDSVVGGVGLRRGRRHPEDIRPGETLDFWRVITVEPGRTLQLHAEMKLPGDAWLTFETEDSRNGSQLRQTAIFVPRGLMGRLYWLAMKPFHLAIFSRMANRIAKAAESRPKVATETSTFRSVDDASR